MNIKINGRTVEIIEGSTVASALMSNGQNAFRKSVKGDPRAPLCGMGVCFECRAKINGREHERTCMVLCQEGMEVEIP